MHKLTSCDASFRTLKIFIPSLYTVKATGNLFWRTLRLSLYCLSSSRTIIMSWRSNWHMNRANGIFWCWHAVNDAKETISDSRTKNLKLLNAQILTSLEINFSLVTDYHLGYFCSQSTLMVHGKPIPQNNYRSAKYYLLTDWSSIFSVHKQATSLKLKQCKTIYTSKIIICLVHDY